MASYLSQFRGFSRNARLLLVTTFCMGLSMATSGLFLNFYLQSLGFGQQFIGLVNALPFAVLIAVGLPVGRLIDRRGPRWGLLVGTITGATGALGVALTGTPTGLLAFTALNGLGTAFGFISIAPFQMANSTEAERVALFSAQSALLTGTAFLGNLAGGRLPGLFALWLGAAPDALAPLRATMLAAAVLSAGAVLPMVVSGPAAVPGSASQTSAAVVHPAHPRGRRRLLERPGLVARLLLPAFLISLGAGQVIPYLNLYISTKFGVRFEALGAVFALGALGTTLATLTQPVLAARVGKIRSVLLVQAASIPFLLILGYAPAFWMVTVALVVRTALMNMGNPVYQAFAQELIPPGERATYSSLSSVAWSLGWALGAAFSGWWRGLVGFASGFGTLFALMTVLYVASIGLMYGFFVRTAPVAQGIAGSSEKSATTPSDPQR